MELMGRFIERERGKCRGHGCVKRLVNSYEAKIREYKVKKRVVRV